MTHGRARLWGGATLLVVLGAILRVWCLRNAVVLSGDTFLYGDIALSWMNHGVYGFSRLPENPIPTLIRLPGYPLFLVLCFRLFGAEHYNAVLNVQAVLDLASCLLLADLARRVAGMRAAMVALALAALCPFTASYVAAALTETLTLTCLTIAFYALERWQGFRSGAGTWTPWNRWLGVMSASVAYSSLLRPEQGLLAVTIFPAVLWISRRNQRAQERRRWWAPALAAAVCTLLPLVPWTIRNARTFHVFQPLAPRSATDPGDPIPTGFDRWYRTWGIDFTSTEDVYWNYDGAAIQIADLPRRAFDSPAQFQQTAALLAEYNATMKPSPAIEARFGAIAADRVRTHPVRYWIGFPVARLINMLLRPRIEMFDLPLAWWRWKENAGETLFAILYGGLNLAYLVAGGVGLYRWVRRRHDRTAVVAWSMIAFVALRCCLLLTLDNSEPRYTLEFFPILIVGIATLVADGRRVT